MAKNENIKEEEKEETGVTEKPKKRTVTVDADKLESFLQRFDELEAKVNSVSDVGRLDNFERKRFQKGPNRFRLSTYDDNGKELVITAWRTVKDVSKKDPVMGMIEDQQYEIILENNKKVEVRGYFNFSELKYSKQIVAEEISRTTDANGTTLKVKLPEGRELTIGAQFVN